MVGTMIAAAIVGATTGFAYYATAFAINYALSYVVTRTFGSNKAPNQIDPGSRQQIPPSANNPIPIAYGDAWLGGTFVDAVLSTDNKTMYYVLAISNISPDGQFTYDTTKFYYGDRLVTFDGTDPTKVVSLTDGAGNVDTKVSGNLYISLYTSTSAGVITNVTGSAPSVVMGGADITPSLRWPASGRQMNGLAFAIVKLIYNSEAGTTGLQPITFKVSHYLNSAGAARPGDVLRDYLTSDVYGCAVPLANVNTTACTALNTYSDQVITYIPYSGGSSTQPRYRINGVLNTGQAVLGNIDKILTACDSWLAYQETTGQWMPVINKAESVSFAFNDSNIIGELRVSISDITQSINQVEASFPWKENKDQPNLVYLETPSGLLYPNEPANKASITLDLVNDSIQAQYLANRMLEQAREDLIVTFATAYTGIQVDAGDVISITNSDYGWSAKPFRAIKVSEISLPDGNLGAQIECTEYNSQVYDDQNITQFTPAPNSGLNSAYFFSALSAPTVSDQLPSAAVPSFSVTCNVPSTGRVTSITLYYTTSATPTTSDWKVWGTEFSADSQAFTPSLAFKFTNVSLPAATYYFAFKVANDVATSQLSTVSSAFVWAPVAPSGTKTAIAYLYQWAASQPGNPSGTSTFTWATATNSGYTGGNGWQTTIPANPGTAGYSLWVAAKEVSESGSVPTTTISWTSGFSVYAQSTNGAAGTSGTSARICFARVPSNPSPVSGSITTTGSVSFPSSAQSLATWGFSATWGASDPNPSSTDSLYQSDGIYDPTTGNTVWTTPYISSLKVGSLSAISANLGTITAGSITSTANINVTGTGYFAGVTTGTQFAALYGTGSPNDIHGVYGETDAVGVAGVRGDNTNASGYGVWGVSYGQGVRGQGTSSGYGGYFTAFDLTKALYADGKITATGQIESTVATGTAPLVVSSTTVVPNLTVRRLQSTVNTSVLSLRTGIGAGASTGTYNPNNKPGANNTTNTWLEIEVDGTIYLIPVWTA